MLQAATTAEQFAGEPVQQLGVAGLIAGEAEVAGAANEPFTEVVHPQSVDNNSRGKCVLGAGNPVRQLQSEPGGAARVRHSEITAAWGWQATERTCGNSLQWPVTLAVFQNMQWLGLSGEVSPSQDFGISQCCCIRSTQQRATSGFQWPRPEGCSKSIIIGLGNRIEFVIVAACTFDRQSQKGGGRRVYQIFKSFINVVLRVIRLIVPCAQSQKSGGNHSLFAAIRDFVSSQLQADKLIPGKICIQCLHDPVSILPGKWFGLVAFIATGVGIAYHIQPVSGPAFTIVRRCEQAVNQLLILNGSQPPLPCPVCGSSQFHVGLQRWQSGYHPAQPSHQFPCSCRRGRCQLMLLQSSRKESINGMRLPGVPGDSRRLRWLSRLQGLQ